VALLHELVQLAHRDAPGASRLVRIGFSSHRGVPALMTHMLNFSLNYFEFYP